MPNKKSNKKQSSPKKEEKIENIEDIENPDEEELEILTTEGGDILSAWEFPEFIKYQRSKLWYISFSLVFLALLVYAYFTDNLLFAIILAIFAILYLTSVKKDPVTMQIAIVEDGIFIGSRFIPYEEIKSFYIIYYPPEIKNLYFETKSVLKQRIAIPLEDENPVEIREILLEFLEEDVEKEEIPSTEGISRILKL